MVPPLNVLGVSPDGSMFAMYSTGTVDDDYAKTLTLADVATGEPAYVIPLPADHDYDVAFGPSRYLLLGITDRNPSGPPTYRFEVWTWPEGEPIVSLAAKTSPEFAALPGERVAVWIDDELRWVNLRDHSVHPTRVARRYRTGVSPSGWAVNPSGDRVAWLPEPGRVHLQPLAGDAGTELPLDEVVRAHALARLGPDALAIADDGGVRRFDLTRAKTERWLETDFTPQDLATAEQGTTLLAVSEDGVVVFDWMTRQVLARSPTIEGLRHVALSDDGARFATLTYDGNIGVFDARNATLVTTATGTPGNGPTIALDASGEMLAAADADMIGRTIVLATGEEHRFTEEQDVETTGLSRNATLIAFAYPATSAEDSESEDTTEVLVFDRVSGEHRSTFRVAGLFAEELEFSPDATLLAINTGMGPTSLVKLENEKTVATLDDAASLAFSADGRWVAGVRYDGDLAFYDTTDGHRLLGIHLSSAANGAVALAPDGRFELVGAAPLSHLECAAGPLALPAEVCRDLFETPGLVRETLRIEPSPSPR
jgi:WD40 repeat protein